MTDAAKRLQRALALHRTLIKTKLEIEEAIQALREEMRVASDDVQREAAMEQRTAVASR